MLKKPFRIIVSTLLVLTFLFSVCVPALAADETVVCPEIYVHGFMANTIYKNPESLDDGTAWPPSTNAILAAVPGAGVSLAKLAATRDWDAFAEQLVPVVDKVFESAEADFNGDITNGSGIEPFVYPDASEITADSKLEFKYDWRQDPAKTAAELNDFVNFVCDASGSDKVSIECHSMGGVITLTYISLYGNEKLHSVLFNSTAIFGESYTGELFGGNITLDSKAITSFMRFAFDENEYKTILTTIFDILDAVGVTPAICKLGNGVLDKIYCKVSISIMKLFVNWSTVWAMVPDEYLDNCMKYVFEEEYPKAGVDFSGLKSKVDFYNSHVRSSKKETLKQLNEKANVYVISRYGYSAFPITPAWNVNSDSNIDAKYSSFGATVAPIGEALNVEAGRYISPDKAVDASTCMFPDQTWFIKYIGHSSGSDNLQAFFRTLMFSKEQKTIDSLEQYPQFMIYDYSQETLSVDTTEPAGSENILKRLEKILNEFVALFKNLLKKLSR